MTKYLGITPINLFPSKTNDRQGYSDGLSIVAIDNDKVVGCTIVEDIVDPLNIMIDIDPRFKIIFSLLENLGGDFFSERAMYKVISHIYPCR